MSCFTYSSLDVYIEVSVCLFQSVQSEEAPQVLLVDGVLRIWKVRVIVHAVLLVIFGILLVG